TAGVNAIAGALVVGDNSGTDTVKLLAANQILDTQAVTVNTGATLSLNNNDETIAAATALTLSSGTVSTGTGTLTLGGNVTSSGTSSVSDKLSLGAATRTFTVSNTLSVPAVISSTGGGLTKAGAG